MGVHWATEAVAELGIDAEIIDLRTLYPMDEETIKASVIKTSKAIVLHEDTLFGGLGGEIAAFISEHLFEYLDGPVVRSASMDTPVPFAISLENEFLPVTRFKKQLMDLVNY